MRRQMSQSKYIHHLLSSCQRPESPPNIPTPTYNTSPQSATSGRSFISNFSTVSSSQLASWLSLTIASSHAGNLPRTASVASASRTSSSLGRAPSSIIYFIAASRSMANSAPRARFAPKGRWLPIRQRPPAGYISQYSNDRGL